jgi:hypothetical protein
MKRAFTGGSVEIDLTSSQALFKVGGSGQACRLTLAQSARVKSQAGPLCAQALKTNGPVAITIWADSNPGMQLYKSGIYAHVDGPTTGEDHAITLVGWGEEKLADNTTSPYWLILNSWGTTWCGIKLICESNSGMWLCHGHLTSAA